MRSINYIKLEGGPTRTHVGKPIGNCLLLADAEMDIVVTSLTTRSKVRVYGVNVKALLILV